MSTSVLFVTTLLTLIAASQQIERKCGRIPPPPQGQPSGSLNGPMGERLPWYAGIYRTTSTPYAYLCGGTLVSSDVVISAAHCFWDHQLGKLHDPKAFLVQIGSLYVAYNPTDADAQRSNVAEVKIPPRFLGNVNNYQDDISLVVLTTPIEYKLYVSPACLDFDPSFDERQLKSGNIGQVTGLLWSKKANGDKSPILATIGVPTLDDAQCFKNAPPGFQTFLTPDKFCLDWTGFKNNTKDCLGKGISGAGILFPETVNGETRYYVRGVISTAPSTGDSPCLETFSTVSHILKHEQFIKDQIKMT